MDICNLVPKKKLFIETINKLKPRNVSITSIDNKKYLLKIEDYNTNLKNMYEYQFYIKNYDKIKLDKFDNIIQIPIKYKICKKKNTINYMFSLLDSDVTHDFLHKLNKKNVINIIKQSLLALYYINHILHYYHNDIVTVRRKYQLNNIMYIKNNKKKILKIDDLSITIEKYRAVIIDFGIASKTPNYKLTYFYNILSIVVLYKFKYISELFLLFISFYYTYTNSLNIYEIKKFYIYFENKMKGNSVKDFDKSIFHYFNELL